jgi:hypothetical protein
VPTNQWPNVISETRKVTEHERITESKEQGGRKKMKFFLIWCDLPVFSMHTAPDSRGSSVTVVTGYGLGQPL